MNDKIPSPKEIAEQLISVQPMDCDIFKNLLKVARPEKELLESGYKPVSNLKFVYIKDGKQ